MLFRSVRKMLVDKYGEEKILSSEKPMLAIAEGAAILAHALSDEFECPSCGEMVNKDVDVCPHCGAKLNATEEGEEEPPILVLIRQSIITTLSLNLATIKLSKLMSCCRLKLVESIKHLQIIKR